GSSRKRRSRRSSAPTAGSVCRSPMPPVPAWPAGRTRIRAASAASTTIGSRITASTRKGCGRSTHSTWSASTYRARAEMSDEAIHSVVSGKTWAEFCDRLKAAGQWILGEDCPADPLDRAEGFRLLTRLTRGALEQFVEYDDPLHPTLVRLCHETIKVIAENPDNIYLASRVDPRCEYRVWGRRGSVRWLSFNTHAGAFGAGGRGTAAALDVNDLKLDADGSFELWVSAQQHAGGNWLHMDSDATVLIVRQTIAD